MLCTNCNAKLLHDDVFCGDCGTPVVRQAAPVAAPGGMTCGNCGVPLVPGDVFCGDCGTPAANQGAAAPVVPAGMSCSKCGQPMEMDDAFCGDCGTPFTPPQMAQPAYQPPPQPVQPQPSYQPPPQPVQPQPTYQPPPQPAYQPAPAPAVSVSSAKIPLVFVIDTSSDTASYLGELNNELNKFKAAMSADSLTNAVLEVAIIQFGERHSLIQNFTGVQYMGQVGFAPSAIQNAAYEPPIREALRLVGELGRSQGTKHKPWVVLIGGSSPVDDISSVAGEIKSAQSFDALRFIALGVDKCNFEALNRLTDVVFRQDGTSFVSFFDWLCGCARAISQTPLGQKPQLPNLKGNVYRDK